MGGVGQKNRIFDQFYEQRTSEKSRHTINKSICRGFFIMQRVRNVTGADLLEGIDGHGVTIAVLDTGIVS